MGDGGDPAELVSAFLADNGLPVRDMGRTATDFHPTGAGTPCGAALYVSASAGSVMVGGPPGAPSPVPGIPDVVAVVHVHGDPDEPSPSVMGAWAMRSSEVGGSAAGAGPGGWRLGPWHDSWTPSEHAAAVGAVRAAIGRGDVYQVNVVGHAWAP